MGMLALFSHIHDTMRALKNRRSDTSCSYLFGKSTFVPATSCSNGSKTTTSCIPVFSFHGIMSVVPLCVVPIPAMPNVHLGNNKAIFPSKRWQLMDHCEAVW